MTDEVTEPKILAFCCNWCSYTGADLAGTSRFQMPPTVRNIRVMCSSRVDPLFIIKALMTGADGVLVAGCFPGDCHYTIGNYFTRRRMALIEKVLETAGIGNERVMLSWISASDGLKYQEVTKEFTKKVKGLGQNQTKKEVFL